MGAGAGLGAGHVLVELDGGVVKHAALVIQHAAVSVGGELVEAGIGHNDEVIAEFLVQAGNAAVQNALRVPGDGAGIVLVLIERHTEKVDARHAGLQRLLGRAAQGVEGVLVDARHGGNLARGVESVHDEHGQNQVRGADLGFGHEVAHLRGGAQAAWAAGWEGAHWVLLRARLKLMPCRP